MKFKKLIHVLLLVVTATSYAQIKVDKIEANNKTHYITTIINYPVSGIYLFEGKTEPIVQLNDDGTGILQNQELIKTNIIWGFECSEEGIPIFKEGFNSASYSLWYQTKDAENEKWTFMQFSIHFNKKKMFIMGERSKDYIDEEMQVRRN